MAPPADSWRTTTPVLPESPLPGPRPKDGTSQPSMNIAKHPAPALNLRKSILTKSRLKVGSDKEGQADVTPLHASRLEAKKIEQDTVVTQHFEEDLDGSLLDSMAAFRVSSPASSRSQPPIAKSTTDELFLIKEKDLDLSSSLPSPFDIKTPPPTSVNTSETDAASLGSPLSEVEWEEEGSSCPWLQERRQSMADTRSDLVTKLAQIGR